MILVLQIAVGIVLGAIMLVLLPVALNALFYVGKNTIIGAGSVALVFGGVLLTYTIFYCVWYYTVNTFPRPILVTMSLASIVVMIYSTILTIKIDMPISSAIAIFAMVLFILFILVFASAWDNFKNYGEVGDTIVYVSPLYMFLASLSLSRVLIYKRHLLEEEQP